MGVCAQYLLKTLSFLKDFLVFSLIKFSKYLKDAPFEGD